jgi:hypothetical protein
MTAAIVAIENADGTTEVWNASQSQADSIRRHLLRDVGAPDLDRRPPCTGGEAPADAGSGVSARIVSRTTENGAGFGTSKGGEEKT